MGRKNGRKVKPEPDPPSWRRSGRFHCLSGRPRRDHRPQVKDVKRFFFVNDAPEKW